MVKILIVEQSYLIRRGLAHALGEFREISQVEVLGSHLGLQEVIHHFCPDVLIINTSIEANITEFNLEDILPLSAKIIHLMNTPLPPVHPPNQISIYDSKSTLIEKLAPFLKKEEDEEDNDTADSEELTTREKLILKQVALGNTNKEIASNLYISIHTVISHRKNITRKLDIKSVSGLTVYAILNGLIKMEELS